MNETDTPKDASMATILVADDTPDVTLVIAKLLEATGYRALCAQSAREALDLLDENEHIRLVLSDIRMPGVDGFDLVRVLRHRFPHLPVILMTGLPITDDDAAPHGVAVVQKPFDVDVLTRLIEEKLSPQGD
jgi:CheY-like chemotaxis protein